MAEKEIKKTKKAKKKPRTPAKKAAPSKPEKVNLYSIDGKSQKKIILPKVFHEDVRTDLIRRAVSIPGQQASAVRTQPRFRDESCVINLGEGERRVQGTEDDPGQNRCGIPR